MKSLQYLVKEFKDKGYQNPLIHAEAKLWALQRVALPNQDAPPQLKPAHIKDFRKAIQKAIKLYVKRGGFISQLAEKKQRKSNSKVAVPINPIIHYRSGHKLTALEALSLKMRREVA
jgi:hypothetical protein